MSRILQLSRRVTPTPHLLPAASSAVSSTAQTRTYSSSTPQPPAPKSSVYMNHLFPRSNSSFKLSSGNSLQSNVVRLSEEVFLVDSGIGSPRVCLQNELIGVKNNRKIRFQNRVGFLDLVSGETPINKQILERFFIDLVAGDSTAKERATARFNDLVGGSTDVNAVGAGEPLLVLPRRYRQKRAWMELTKKWQSNSQVKGFIVGRVRGGYSVAVAGFIAFVPFRGSVPYGRRLSSDRFTVESINSKNGNIRLV